MFAWRALPAAPGFAPGAVLTVPSLLGAGIRVAFTGKAGGLGDGDLDLSLLGGAQREIVVRNRGRALAAGGASSIDAWCSGRQVHGANVEHVGRSSRGRGSEDVETSFPDTDALWTEEPDVACVVLTADCVPVFLADPARRRIGVVHAGWRGLVAGVIDAAVAAMGSSRDLRAYIGPSIGPCCYEVGAEVMTEARGSFGDQVAVGDNLDLWRAAQLSLARAGCAAVHPSLMCTRCQTHRFFSHRGGDPGRQGLIARIDP